MDPPFGNVVQILNIVKDIQEKVNLLTKNEINSSNKGCSCEKISEIVQKELFSYRTITGEKEPRYNWSYPPLGILAKPIQEENSSLDKPK